MKKKNKKGFTLVELMLAIALIALISTLFISLMVAIKESYQRTYNANDATDYAQLYAQAIENVILKDTQRNVASGSTFVYQVNGTDSTLMVNGTPIFQLEQMTNRDGVVKWNIYIDKNNTYFEEDSGIFHYKFILVDGYNYEFGHPGTVQLEYEGAFWIPHFNQGTFTFESNGNVTAHYNDGEICSITNCKIIYTAD